MVDKIKVIFFAVKFYSCYMKLEYLLFLLLICSSCNRTKQKEVDFLPRKVTNEYVLSCCYHAELENYVTEDMLDEINRQKFKDLMNEKKEMNPVIIKYYYK